MVKIIIGNIYSKISGYLPDCVHSDLAFALSYKLKDAKYIPAVKNNKWDGIVRLYMKDKGQSFYTGLMGFVREILKKHNIEYEIIDRRVVPEQNLPNLKFFAPENYKIRDYQEFTVNRSLKFTRGILSICTGGGKTLIVTKIISQIKTSPFVFYVLTRDLMIQAYDVLSSCLNEPIGMIGDGICDIKKINVCTIQTAIMALNNGKEFKISDYQFDEEDIWDEKAIESEEKARAIRQMINDAKGVYFDEVHHAASRTCKEVLTASVNAYWRFGGSATPYRESGDEILIQAMFGAKIVDISASYLIKMGYLVKPYIFFVSVNDVTNYHTYAKIYKSCIAENNAFNQKVANIANHLVKRNLSTLVLVQQYSHGDYLKTLIPGSEFMTGKITSKKRTEILEKLRQKEIKIVIATSLADEGLDVPILDAVILAGGGASATRVNQRIGRTLRKNPLCKDKNKSIVIIFEHSARYLCRHAIKTRKILNKEKEFILKMSKGFEYLNNEIDEILGYEKSVDVFNA